MDPQIQTMNPSDLQLMRNNNVILIKVNFLSRIISRLSIFRISSCGNPDKFIHYNFYRNLKLADSGVTFKVYGILHKFISINAGKP